MLDGAGLRGRGSARSIRWMQDCLGHAGREQAVAGDAGGALLLS